MQGITKDKRWFKEVHRVVERVYRVAKGVYSRIHLLWGYKGYLVKYRRFMVGTEGL